MRRPYEFADHPVSFGAAQSEGMYRAHCLHVVDGDTFDVMIDKGFYAYGYHTIRLRLLSAPELFRGTPEERALGKLAADALRGLILERPLLIRTWKDAETFGRFVADAVGFIDEVRVDVARWMSDAGYGTLGTTQ